MSGMSWGIPAIAFPHYLVVAGSRTGRRGPFVSAKGPKTMMFQYAALRVPSTLDGLGGSAIRCAQALPSS
jgi:hypothetical protein